MTQPPRQSPSSVQILGYRAVKSTEKDTAIDRIFFAASSVQAFTDDAARLRFRERWLGRYLRLWPQHAFIAVQNSVVVGYLVGCLDDPARLELFSDIPYFATFAPLTARYPAHLHINLAPEARSQGIGARLIEAFRTQAAAAGVAGMHVVTGAGLRNVRFYERCGFVEAGRTGHKDGEVVFLARSTGLKPGL